MNLAFAVGLVVVTALLGASVGLEAAAAVPALLLVVVLLLFMKRGFAARAIRPDSVQVIETPTPDTDTGSWARLVLAALVVHWATAILLNATSLWTGFAPDAVFYELAGQAIVDSWTDPTVDLRLWFGRSDSIKFYPYLNAASLWSFGSARWPLSFANGVVGVVAAFVAGRLAGEMFGPRTARRVFVLCAFFPSMITWTSMNIREAWSFLILILIVRGAYHLRRRINPMDLLLVVGCLFWLGFVRAYLVPLVLLAVLTSFLVVRWSQIPYAFAALAVLGLVMFTLGDSLGLSVDAVTAENLAAVQTMRENLAFGGSAYGTEVDTSTMGGALLYLPEGLFRFLFAPFPWTVSSWRQLVALPETFVWYWFFYQAMRGAWTTLREDASKVVLPGAVLVLVTSAYALASGNEGTAYRHRAQVMLFFFLFTAVYQVRTSRGRS